MDEFEEPLNKKNITGEILGMDDDFEFNLDTMPDDDGFEKLNNQALDPTADNAIVNIIDLFITTSPAILAKYGYPAPDLDVWKNWAKPNFNVAFNHYVPAGAMVGGAVSMPIIAALIGVAAIGVTFLPVILYHMDKKRKEREIESTLDVIEEIPEEPEPEKESPTPSTEVSNHVMSVADRMSQIEEQVV